MKTVLVFYSRLPGSDFSGKTRLGRAVKNIPATRSFAKTMICELFTEYASSLQWDLCWYFRGDLQKFSPPTSKKIFFEEQIPGELSIEHIHKKMATRYDRVIIVGSDIPLISRNTICSAFSSLLKKETVLLPVMDGGYGLIGSRGFVDMYSDISEWNSRSTHYHLFSETLSILKREKKTVEILPTTFDIDEKQDIVALLAQKNNPHFSYLSQTFVAAKTLLTASQKKKDI